MKKFCAVEAAFNIHLSRMIMRAFYIFPVHKKKIFFTSYEGKQFSCNPKYIYLKLKESGREDLQYVYEYNHDDVPEELQNGVKIVRHNRFSYFKELMTSGVVVTNSGITAKIPVRSSQTVINTWHGGGAYKKVGKDISSEINGSGAEFVDISQRQTTYFLSSSRRFSEVSHSSFGMPFEKMVNTGMPRNDIFWKDSAAVLKERICREYHLSRDAKLVLYAPTYRGKAGNVDEFSRDNLDAKMILGALKERFGGQWKLLYRGHYFETVKGSDALCTDVSGYSDMQELLAAVDVLITDYSSVVWDFSLTDKPGFLFVPDLKHYEEERPLYTPVDQWPYGYAETNEKLASLIIQFDEQEQRDRCRQHHEDFESYEKGNATEQAVRLIERSFMQSGWQS